MRLQDDKGRFVRQPMLDRFWNYVDKSTEPDGCWLWTGSMSKAGYGRFTDFWVKFLAHRVAYEAVNGPIPSGLLVCHSCDVRVCVNPAHLWLGTHKDNIRDAMSKGRFPSQKPKDPAKPAVVHRGIDNGMAKLTDAEVRAIRAAYIPRPPGRAKGGANGAVAPGSVRALAAEYGVATSLVQRIIKRTAWAHLE